MRRIPAWRDLSTVTILLAAFSQIARCADREGVYDYDCHPATYIRLHQPRKARGKALPGSDLLLTLRFDFSAPFHDVDETGWIKAKGQLCVHGWINCEELTSARVRYDKNEPRHWHTGEFSVDYPNGAHEEGRFKAKRQHNGPEPRCE